MLLNKKTTFLLFSFLIPLFLFAQQGKIQATIVDAKTHEPIIGASAALLQAGTNTYVKGAQTDLEGRLFFETVANGNYLIRITYVGMQDFLREGIVIQNNAAVNLGQIGLTADGTMLEAVVVKGRTPELTLGIDRKVFDVSQSLVSVGGTASDLLANVPTLQVDMDGTVSLRGSSSVRILIDGKESALAGGNITSLLQSLPANAIEKVEIITNPSSKYDAEGQSGIINIVLKKNIRTGLNGNVNVSGGSYHNYQAGVALNYRDRKFNYFGTYNFGRRNNVGSGSRYNHYLNNDSHVDQDEENNRKSLGHTFKLGTDYYLNDKTTIGLSGNVNIRDNERNADMFYRYSNHPTLSGTSTRLSHQTGDEWGYDLNFDFTRKFNREGSELTANVRYGQSAEDGVNDFVQSYSVARPNDGRTNTTSQDGKVFNAQLDYVLPLNDKSKFEAGYRTQITKSFDTQFSELLNVNNQQYYPDYSVSNDFDLTNTIHALYANYQNKLTSKLGYQIGLRAEDSKLNTTYFSKDPATAPGDVETKGGLDYFRLYPSLFLTYDIGKAGDKIQLSYTRRVQRPRGWQVNPFPSVADELNRREGNANLLPEDVHSMELSFAKFFEGWNIVSSVYYRKVNDVIQPYIYKVDDSGVTYSRWENLSSTQVAGLELISKVNLTKWWDLTWNGNFLYNKFNGNSAYNIQEQDGFTWNSNVNTNVKFTGNLAMQIRGDYYAPRVMAQGKSKSMTGVDVALKQELFDKRASLAFNVRDLFDTRRFGANTMTPQVNSSFDYRWMKRSFNLSFSYRFGRQEASKKRQQNEGGGMDDMQGNF